MSSLTPDSASHSASGSVNAMDAAEALHLRTWRVRVAAPDGLARQPDGLAESTPRHHARVEAQGLHVHHGERRLEMGGGRVVTLEVGQRAGTCSRLVADEFFVLGGGEQSGRQVTTRLRQGDLEQPAAPYGSVLTRPGLSSISG